jgi:hypothetical protein
MSESDKVPHLFIHNMISDSTNLQPMMIEFFALCCGLGVLFDLYGILRLVTTDLEWASFAGNMVADPNNVGALMLRVVDHPHERPPVLPANPLPSQVELAREAQQQKRYLETQTALSFALKTLKLNIDPVIVATITAAAAEEGIPNLDAIEFIRRLRVASTLTPEKCNDLVRSLTASIGVSTPLNSRLQFHAEVNTKLNAAPGFAQNAASQIAAIITQARNDGDASIVQAAEHFYHDVPDMPDHTVPRFCAYLRLHVPNIRATMASRGQPYNTNAFAAATITAAPAIVPATAPRPPCSLCGGNHSPRKCRNSVGCSVCGYRKHKDKAHEACRNPRGCHPTTH